MDRARTYAAETRTIRARADRAGPEEPLLERKRLLDGAIQPAELVRVTPYVRPPVATFAGTWSGLGFSELVYKAANSRYFPGERNEEWIVAPIPRR